MSRHLVLDQQTMEILKKTIPEPGSAQLAIVSDVVDKNDSRLLKQLSSLRAAGYSVELIAMSDSGTTSPLATIINWRSQLGPVLVLGGAIGAFGVFLAFLRQGTKVSIDAAKGWIKYKARCSALVDYVSKKNIDLLIVSGPETIPPSISIKKKIGVGIIYDAHEFYENEDVSEPDRGVWVRRIETAAEGFLDEFITVNEGIANLYKNEHPAFPEPRIVHNSAIPSKITYDGRLHAAAGLPLDARIILYQGGLAPMRGLEQLVDSASQLSEEWNIVILGNGRMEQALRQRAPREKVSFIPAVPSDELLKWTSGASLGAMLYEGVTQNQTYCTPNKLWEYPAAGVPILSSDLPEIKRLIGPYGAAFFLPDGVGSEEIARKVNSITKVDLENARLGCNSFTLENNWSQSSKLLIETVDSVLNRRFGNS